MGNVEENETLECIVYSKKKYDSINLFLFIICVINQMKKYDELFFEKKTKWKCLFSDFL